MDRPTVPRHVWITAILLWLLPGGTLWAFIYLFFQEVKFDEKASAWSKASFAEFRELRRKEKEAANDVHPISNQ